MVNKKILRKGDSILIVEEKRVFEYPDRGIVRIHDFKTTAEVEEFIAGARIEITKEKFEAYLTVQKSGITNMFDINNVIGLSARITEVTLIKEEILEIMKNYKEYKEKYK